jgi:RimJ/RimL family protein N-acetyltransferase
MENLDYNEKDYEVRILKPEDVTSGYVKWISDPEITKYSRNRYRTFTLEGQIEYVQQMFDSPNFHLYGIFHKKTHIGNIAFGPIDWVNNIAEARVVIGYKKYWGKKVMGSCFNKVIKMSFGSYPFFKICADTYSKNLPTIFAMKKFGFTKEGHRKYHRVFEDIRVDLLEYSLFLEHGEPVKYEN